jgi:signal transduction histidine kinase
MENKPHEPGLAGVASRFGGGIRRRLIGVGLILTLLSLSVPLYLLLRMNDVAALHHVSTEKLNYLIEVDMFETVANETAAAVKIYLAGGAVNILPLVSKNRALMEEILKDLESGRLYKTEYALLVNALREQYATWDRTVLSRIESIPRPYPRGEAEYVKLNAALNHLESTLHSDTLRADAVVGRVSRSSRLFAVVGSVVVFILAMGAMFFLWSQLIPGFKALTIAAHEIKSGRLGYRITGPILEREDAFSIVATAFNDMALSLEEQHVKLIELSRLKTDFVATVSHELRTPLTSIKGGLGLVLGGVTGDISSETKSLLETTARNTDRLIRLINDVLDISKIEAGAIRLRVDHFDVSELVTHATKAMESYAKSHGVSVRWKAPSDSPILVVDRDRFEQIMTNLLSNAIKFSPDDGIVTITMQEEHDRVLFKVSDHGPGIPAEKQQLLFRKFSQVLGNVANKNVEGTGLGLAICKALVEEHGGRVWVESEKGQGADFYFSLPWNGKDRVTPPAPAAGAADAA